MSTDNEVTSVSDWKSKAAPTELPSGNKARIKIPGVEMMLQSGKIPNRLLSIMTEQLNDGEEINTDEIMKGIVENPDELTQMIDMVDFLAVRCFVEPKVYPNPPEGEEPDEDKLYAGDIAFEDKIFILNAAVGGTKDLDQFREGLASSVDAVQSGNEVALPPE